MRTVLLAAAISLSLITNVYSQDREPVKSAFDIPAQSLADSLRAIATTTQTSVLFDDKAVAGRKVPGIKANLTVDQAMTEVLKGTGLTYRYLNERTIVLASNTKTSSRANDGENEDEGTGKL